MQMNFGNRLLPLQQLPDNAIRVAFHTLRKGDKYQVFPGGSIVTVIERGADFATIRRADDWLIGVRHDDFIWDRMVIKIN